MMRRILVITALMLAAPASAHAATLTKSGSTLTYVGGAGVNEVTFTESPPGTVVVQRTGADNDAIAATGCTTPEIVPGRTIQCAGITTVVADGGAGDDTLDASGLTAARAALGGGAGSDVLSGGAAADTLAGGDGDDSLAGGAGADAIAGGSGIDSVAYAGTPLTVTLDDVAGDGTANEGDNVHSDVEDVSADPGAGGTATLTGSASGNVLSIGTGGGAITGGAGSDTLSGGPAADTIDARDGFADRVSCGAGTDTVKADQLDQVAADCENVTTEPVIGGADDRPPAVTWAAPGSGAELSADDATTLAVSATDDHGVARVQFYDDDRLVCDDTLAPYTCAYAPRGGDVGRDTLIARAVDTADQSASAVQAITVGRFASKAFTLKLGPSRDKFAPYRFTATGKLTLPPQVAPTQGCSGGQVTITAKAGKTTVATRHATLSRHCEYKLKLSFAHRRGSRLRITARFDGNDVMKARTATTRTARTG
jgi:hypothetical protein